MTNFTKFVAFYYVRSVQHPEPVKQEFDKFHAISVDSDLTTNGIPYTKALYLVNLWNRQGKGQYIYTIE